MKSFWKKKKQDPSPIPPDAKEQLDLELKKIELKNAIHDFINKPKKIELDKKRLAIDKVQQLQYLLQSYYFENPEIPGAELRIHITFNDAELAIIKNRLFSAIDEL